MKSRIFVIGDIHGHYKKFKTLYEKLNMIEEDKMIFLGDYIDRGPKGENFLMLDWIMKAVKRENVIALKGNHERMMQNFYEEGDMNWIFNGGNSTFKDIKRIKKDDSTFIDKLIKFLRELPISYRITINKQKYFFCHAGVNPKLAIEDQSERSLLWIRNKFYDHYDGEEIVVVGHTPIQFLKDVKEVKPQWRRGGKVLMMDTGSYFERGCISCMDLVSGKIYQSD